MNKILKQKIFNLSEIKNDQNTLDKIIEMIINFCE